MVIPPHLSLFQRNRIISAFSPDIVILQKCRHALNKYEFVKDTQFVFDLDDADFLDEKLKLEMEEVACNAIGIIAGSRYIQDWAKKFNENSVVIWTGSEITLGNRPRHSVRKSIVTWAQAEPLNYFKEFEFIRDVIIKSHRLNPSFTFRLYGWVHEADHEALTPFRDNGVPVEFFAPMNYQRFLMSLREVSVGLSIASTKSENEYSSGKSFGKILAYLDAGVPVVCNDAADHKLLFNSYTGIVADTLHEFSSGVLKLLEDESLRQSMSDAAFSMFRSRLSIDVAAKLTSNFLLRTLGSDQCDRATKGALAVDRARPR